MFKKNRLLPNLITLLTTPTGFHQKSFLLSMTRELGPVSYFFDPELFLIGSYDVHDGIAEER